MPGKLRRTDTAKSFVGKVAKVAKAARALSFSSRRSSSSSSMGTTALTVRPGRWLAGAQILPDRLNTVFETTGSWYVPATNMSASAGNFMNIMVNSIYQPFQGGYPVTTAVNTYSMHGAWVQGYSGTQNPIGYNGVANLYTNYKVKKIKIQVTCQPQNSGDTTQVVVFPIGSEAIPSSAAGSVNLQVMLGQPRNKTAVCVNGATSKYNTVTLSENVWDILGKRKAQYMDTLGTAIGAQPPNASDQAFVGIFAQILDNATNSAPVVFSVRMWQYTELTDLIQQIN